MLKRNSPPSISLPNTIKIPQASSKTLRNGARLFWVNSGNDPVCRLDIILDAGSRYQQQSLESSATFAMLTEGTQKHTSQQIAEFFDFHGSFTDFSSDRDWGRITLYSLKKYFPQSISMLTELINEPLFPEKELNSWCSRNQQSLLVELDKTSTLARQAFFQSLFGNCHYYGRFATPDDYNKLTVNNIQDFHRRYIHGKSSTFVLAGEVDESEIALVEKYFGDGSQDANGDEFKSTCLPATPSYGLSFVPKDDAVQSSIRVGCELFKRNHPDYPSMLVMNTLLGGYFGSRLMKNLREAKGFTYGVGSHIVTLRDTGFLAISTEVGANFTQPAIDEIIKEIVKLKQYPVEIDELKQVQSYMWGEALRSFNGPFSIADSMISLLNFNDLDYGFYDNLFRTLNGITPETIQEMANKWIDTEKLVIAVAGAIEPKV